ncbi:PREDICTED: uncharacterized protein LOC106817681 [Priapulus caudatus]|uniref:Uncharacterized protein LOC106817681 n=1 Tax=Priapulus caudatus TaxID=37621 RepID=A0ABM1F082_PRICU|nr:PREDICTED: uncharacterized protein LOC106817681 [Priapulus caudatus]
MKTLIFLLLVTLLVAVVCHPDRRRGHGNFENFFERFCPLGRPARACTRAGGTVVCDDTWQDGSCECVPALDAVGWKINTRGCTCSSSSAGDDSILDLPTNLCFDINRNDGGDGINLCNCTLREDGIATGYQFEYIFCGDEC